MYDVIAGVVVFYLLGAALVWVPAALMSLEIVFRAGAPDEDYREVVKEHLVRSAQEDLRGMGTPLLIGLLWPILLAGAAVVSVWSVVKQFVRGAAKVTDAPRKVQALSQRFIPGPSAGELTVVARQGGELSLSEEEK